MADSKTYTGIIYKITDNAVWFDGNIYYGDWDDPLYRTNEPVKYPRTIAPYYPPATTSNIKTEVTNQEDERKEDEMISKQDFLDALMDEGKSITPEQREVIREADDRKWKMFVARLLARVFESGDLEVLKEKPKEVLVREG